MLAAAACKADTRVDITLRPNGTGTVTAQVHLDADAAHRLAAGSTLAKAVPLDDLRAAGWQISAWHLGATGDATITLTHEFTDQGDLARRLADLTGTNGVLREPRIVRQRGWFTTRDRLSVVVDLHAPSTGVASDAQLVQQLQRAGLDVSSLDQTLTTQLRDALTLQVALHVPNAPTRVVTLSPGQSREAVASHSNFELDRFISAGLGIVLALLALMFLTAAGVGRRRERRRRRARASSA